MPVGTAVLSQLIIVTLEWADNWTYEHMSHIILTDRYLIISRKSAKISCSQMETRGIDKLRQWHYPQCLFSRTDFQLLIYNLA